MNWIHKKLPYISMKNDNTYYNTIYRMNSFYGKTLILDHVQLTAFYQQWNRICVSLMSSEFWTWSKEIRLKNDILQFDKNLDLSTFPATILMALFRFIPSRLIHTQFKMHKHYIKSYSIFNTKPQLSRSTDNASYWISWFNVQRYVGRYFITS